MLAFRDLSIKRKLTLSSVTTSIVVLLFVSTLLTGYEMMTYRQTTLDDLETTAVIIGTNYTLSSSFSDSLRAEKLLGTLVKLPLISAASIYDETGNPFAYYLRSNTEPAQIPHRPGPDGHHFSDGILQLFKPLTYEGLRIGTIYLRSDAELFSPRVRENGLIILLALVLSAPLAVLLSSKLHTMISAPIAHLEQTIGAVSSRLDYNLRSQPVGRDEIGRLAQAFNSLLDKFQREIDDRCQAQEQIETLARFPDEALSPSLRFSIKGKVLYANPPASVLLDLWQVKVGETLPSEWMERIVGIFAKGESEEIEAIDNTGRIYSLTCVPVLAYNYLNIYGRDITNRRQAELALRRSKTELEEAHRQLQEHQAQMLQAEKMASIGQLAAGVAHELNNPIAFVFSNFSTLEEYIRDLSTLLNAYAALENSLKLDDEKDIRTNIQRIQRQKEEVDLDFILGDIDELISESRTGVERVRNIVLNLKDFSHVDKDQQIRANLNENIDHTLNIVLSDLEKKAELEREYGDIPDVLCYPRELNLALMGMILNAMQAIEHKGHIKIRTYQDNGFVCVDIADDGMGIPPEIQKRIFEPFFTTKEVGSGTGMGLSLAYNTIVSHHGGELQVDSEEGIGTKFTIRIPA